MTLWRKYAGGGWRHGISAAETSAARGWDDILGAIITGGGGIDSAVAEEVRELRVRNRTALSPNIAQNSGRPQLRRARCITSIPHSSGIAEELRRHIPLGYYPEKAGTLGERRQIKTA